MLRSHGLGFRAQGGAGPLQDTVAERISRRDEEALQHLEDVRLLRSPGGGAVVEFVFRPNPCFRNRVLRRGVVAAGNGPNSGVCHFSVASHLEFVSGCLWSHPGQPQSPSVGTRAVAASSGPGSFSAHLFRELVILSPWPCQSLNSQVHQLPLSSGRAVTASFLPVIRRKWGCLFVGGPDERHLGCPRVPTWCAGLMGSGVVEETTEIEWKEGKNLTVRQVLKKGGAGKKVAELWAP